MLVALLGQETGGACYAQLKEDKEKKAELSEYLLPDGRSRALHLIMLLFQQNHLDVTEARSGIYHCQCP